MGEFVVVPWPSEVEWLTVNQLIFSKDTTKLEEAYEKLRCWKARCHRLPAGIECTLAILEAILVESRVKDVINNTIIIKSVYALAITRFLNHVASFDKEKLSLSLYKIAGLLNIPEWMVNLRHEAAHGAEMPSLEVLRAGVQLALDWLHSTYWMKGFPMEMTPSNVKFKTFEFEKKLQTLVDVYQELYHQKIKGVQLVADIKNSDLLDALDDIRTFGELRLKRKLIHKNWLMNEEVPVTINELTDMLIRKLLFLLNTAQKENRLSEVIQSFLKVSYFLPKKEDFFIFESVKDSWTKDRITFHMRGMWGKLLQHAFQKSGALPVLLKELVDLHNLAGFRQRWAAYWVKEISLAIKKAIFMRKMLINKGIKIEDFLLLCETNAHASRKVMRKLRSFPEYLELVDVIELSPHPVPDVNLLIEDIIYHPRRNSKIYFKELLDIYGKPLSDLKKKKLVKAAGIYLMDYKPQDVSTDTKIFDLEDVRSLIKRRKPAGEESQRFLQYLDSASEPYDWEGTPIGILPWQENTDSLKNEEVTYSLSED